MSELSTKRCPKCGLYLPLSSFHKDRSKKDGRRSHCKECVKAYMVAYMVDYTADPDKLKARRKANHAANREKINARNRASHAANRERNNRRKRAYYRTPRGFTNRLWYHLNCRTTNGKYPRWKNESICRRYLDKGIRLEITWDELYQFVLLHWDFIQAIWAIGESADLHRPNGNGHYSLDNMQFLPHLEHMRLHGKQKKREAI